MNICFLCIQDYLKTPPCHSKGYQNIFILNTLKYMRKLIDFFPVRQTTSVEIGQDCNY